MRSNTLKLGLVFLLAGSVGVACSATRTGAGSRPANSVEPTRTEANPLAQDALPLAQQAQREPHRFNLRSHEPHRIQEVPRPPLFSALPAMVDNSRGCFEPAYDEYRSRPYSAPRRASGYGNAAAPMSAGVGGGGSSSDKGRARAEASPLKDSQAAAPAPAKPAAKVDRKASANEAQAEGAVAARDDARLSAAQPEQERSQQAPPQANGYGASIYLSNDDTMSLSSAQRVLWAIDRYQPIQPSQVRPHELLNYFSFDTAPVEPDHDFSVVAQLAPSETDPNQVSLGLAVQGRPVSQASRRNANLAFVIDRSGSMAAEGRMEYLKQGLRRSLKELKNGDIVHVTLFDTNACDLIQNFVVGRDPMSRLEQALARVTPTGSTNLHAGLQNGYQAVDRTYQPNYSNRVLLITDAIANTGITDPALLALVARNYDDRRVRLSGVGVGSDFNDSLLDELTERGKGAYVFLGSAGEVDAVFGPRFVSLIETVATDVHFKLSLPPSLALETFHGEEASTQKERVQAIHYFAGTSQMFLSDLRTRDGRVPAEDDILVTIEYQDPERGGARIEEFAWNIGQITQRDGNLGKAQLVATFAERLQQIAALPVSDYRPMAHGYSDQKAAGLCAQTQRDIEHIASPLRADPEVRRVENLWSQFCRRYPVATRPAEPAVQPTVHPQRNNDYAPKDSWPGARG